MHILLANPTQIASNDAFVTKYIHPPPYAPGPYTRRSIPTTLPYVPSLSWFCITKLAQVGCEQANAIGVRLNYRPPSTNKAYDLLRALIPSLASPDFDWADSEVDPRLWASIVQIYDNLPPMFRCFSIPLADEHLPLLQSIESTAQFSLVTLLELPGCRELSDSTIVNLKHLHGLCALDASATILSAYGLQVLAGTVLLETRDLTPTPSRPRPGGQGPWALRILRLRNCKGIDDNILHHLFSFPLLSILDLRGTHCHPDTFLPFFEPAPRSEHALYHPTPLRLSITLLRPTSKLFSSTNIFTLHINTLHHDPNFTRAVVQESHAENVSVTFTSGSKGCIVRSGAPVQQSRNYFRRSDRANGAEDCRCLDCVTGPSRPIHSQHSRAPELQNRVADEELFHLSAQQDIATFYGVRRPVARPARFRGFSYPLEAPIPPSEEDAQLMLYRLPPPWSVMETLVPDTPPVKPKPANVALAAVTLSKRRMAQMAESMEHINQKRRKTERDAMQQSGMRAPETLSLARNPFRRKVDKTDTPPKNLRPLKPISSIATPLIPPSGQVRGVETAKSLPERSDSRLLTPMLNKPKSKPNSVRGKPQSTKGPQKPAAFNWGSWSKGS